MCALVFTTVYITAGKETFRAEMQELFPNCELLQNIFWDAILFVTVVAKYLSFTTFSEDLFDTSQKLCISLLSLEQDDSESPAVWDVLNDR